MTTKATPFSDMRDVRRANAEKGHCFFSTDTMRWWRSKVETILYRGRWFITSEQQEDGRGFDMNGKPVPATPRVYSVRYAEDDGTIQTVEGASHLTTFKAALDAMWADINQREEQ